jgi:serine/threonine protein kinase
MSGALAAAILGAMARAAVAPQGLEPGTVLCGKFRVERVLGRGGMGLVVEATHLELKRRVALKFLLPSYAHQPLRYPTMRALATASPGALAPDELELAAGEKGAERARRRGFPGASRPPHPQPPAPFSRVGKGEQSREAPA